VTVRGYCGECVAPIAIDDPDTAASGRCGRCGRAWAYSPGTGDAGVVRRCGFCGGRAFFVQRDFDQRLGCLIMAGAIVVAIFCGWRFGWIYFTPVLLATVLIDWVLSLRVGRVTICYRCDSEYRGSKPNPRHRPYDAHVAERYASVKTLRRMGEAPPP